MSSDSSSQVGASPEPGIFISYAREDSESARRIAEALRGFGISVWFDLNELRGGDSWDAKIRSQVRSCTLFLAVISRTTQARGEGYFRREWKLAVERTHDMADTIPFIVPVAIDDTAENSALVPEQFMRVQWSRLEGGLPTTKFVEQVRRLLERSQPSASTRAPSGSAPRPASKPPAGRALFASIAVAAAAIAVAGYLALRRPASPPPQAAPAATPAPAAVDSASVAVLPFANMSEEKDSAFFADGIHEDVLTNLALVKDLHVISRTSVMQYRDTTKPIRQIARELGVAYVLEGSVRRDGNKVRVTGQLIDGRTDEHVWAKMYDKDLTDIFAVQGEIAQEIANSLHIAISPGAEKLIERKRTQNPAAYDLWLKARALSNDGSHNEDGMQKQEEMLKAATDLDPGFAEAWGDLAVCQALKHFWDLDTSAETLDSAKTAIETAQRLSPESPEVITDVGSYYYYAFRDYDRATDCYLRLKAIRPNDSVVYFSLGLIARRKGDWWTSLSYLRKAARLDPANGSIHVALFQDCLSLNRFDEARTVKRQWIDRDPGNLDEQFDLAELSYQERDSRAETEGFLAALTPEEAESPTGLKLRKRWATETGNWAEYVRLSKKQPIDANSPFGREGQVAMRAVTLAASGDTDAAMATAREIETLLAPRIQANPKGAVNLMNFGLAEALLGKRSEALSYAQRSTEAMPISLDHLDGVVVAEFAAGVRAWAGARDDAIGALSVLMRMPGGFADPNYIKRGALFKPLQNDPRVEAWTKDPTYWAAMQRPPEFPAPASDPDVE